MTKILRFPAPRRSLGGIALVLAASVAVPFAWAQFTTNFVPPYRGLPGTDYCQWEDMLVPSGGTNSPDHPASTNFDATLEQLDPSAFNLGGNIYSFSAPLDCVVSDSVPFGDLKEVDFQVSTKGSELDYSGVALTYVNASGIVVSVPPTTTTELHKLANMGFDVETLFHWDLGASVDVITAYQISFKAAAPSMSLDAVILDARFRDLPTTYCTAKITSEGCIPAIAHAGFPSVSAPAAFTISVTQLLPNVSGILVWGSSGPASTPFLGGLLCMQGPFHRTAVQNTLGAGSCTGSLSYDFNALIQAGTEPELQLGQQVQAQFWSRDTGFAAPDNVSLSDALQFVIDV